MKEIILKIPVSEYNTISEMDAADVLLAEKAKEAAQSAYAPYSGFKVGAAIRLANGEIVTGSNQENAAYPSGLCAERVALFWAGSKSGNQAVVSLAVAAFKEGVMTAEPISPCGACRQVFAECELRHSKSFSVILLGEKRVYKFEKSGYLLPFSFDPDAL